MENALKNKIANTSINDEIDNASTEALKAVNKLMKALNNANKELIKEDATKEEERFDMEQFSANSICVDRLLQARGIISQISNNCFKKDLQS